MISPQWLCACVQYVYSDLQSVKRTALPDEQNAYLSSFYRVISDDYSRCAWKKKPLKATTIASGNEQQAKDNMRPLSLTSATYTVNLPFVHFSCLNDTWKYTSWQECDFFYVSCKKLPANAHFPYPISLVIHRNITSFKN